MSNPNPTTLEEIIEEERTQLMIAGRVLGCASVAIVVTLTGFQPVVLTVKVCLDRGMRAGLVKGCLSIVNYRAGTNC